mmetsp:Transcript_34273/g.79189  ORF Transcript_34273/g.79189 Transcript_34273/m.79189 type:complete len:168 (+) Transcript_34273:1636-2139(+)
MEKLTAQSSHHHHHLPQAHHSQPPTHHSHQHISSSSRSNTGTRRTSSSSHHHHHHHSQSSHSVPVTQPSTSRRDISPVPFSPRNGGELLGAIGPDMFSSSPPSASHRKRAHHYSRSSSRQQHHQPIQAAPMMPTASFPELSSSPSMGHNMDMVDDSNDPLLMFLENL